MKSATQGWRKLVCAAALFALNPGAAKAQTNAPLPYAIDLPTTLRLAGAQNLDVQLAAERLNEARANRQSALEQFFPWIAPGVAYHRRDGVAQAVPSGVISDAHFQSYSPGAGVSAQTAFGEAIYSALAAKQLLKASDLALEAQRQDSVLTAANGYFDLTKAKALVGVARQAVETSHEYQQQLHAAVTLGIAFKGDELRVQTQTERYQIAVRQALETQRVSAANLAQVLHLDPAVELVPVDTDLAPITLIETNTPLALLVQQALHSRPELKQSEALVSASRAAKNGAIYGPLIPALGAQAFGGGLGGGPDGGPNTFGPEGDYTVGLSWKIGPGGLFDSGRIHASQARLSATQLTAAKLKDSIVAEVVSSLAHIQSLSDQIALVERNLNTASETFRLTRERKQLGVGIVLEDIQAQQALTQARSDYVSALADYNKAQFALHKAIGAPQTAASLSARH